MLKLVILNKFIRFYSINNKGYINGKWVSASGGKTFKIFNPASGEIITEIPDMDVEDAKSAIDAANVAFLNWKNFSGQKRGNFLREWSRNLMKNSEELGKIVEIESGKPRKEALSEVLYGNSFLEWFSEEARRCYGEIVPSPDKTKQILHLKEPIGVSGLITPWNFPVAMITRKAGAALAAGCTVVIKPAQDTPLSALKLAQYAHESCIPPGVINVITCSQSQASKIGEELCQNSKVHFITFTGSPKVGKTLHNLCSSSLKKICLELGGNAPFIIFKTANLQKSIVDLSYSKFRNCGQTCIAPNRILIESEIFDCFIKKFIDFIKINVGFEREKENFKIPLGPIINEGQIKRIDLMVRDAVDKGARLLIGGEIASRVGPLYYEPTVLTNLNQSMACFNEEVFGPVVSCIKFSDEKEALELANSTPQGLAGYFYTSDISQAWRVAQGLEVGMVGINESRISTPEAAFGGVKQSGQGREGSHHGLDEFINIKYICFGNL